MVDDFKVTIGMAISNGKESIAIVKQFNATLYQTVGLVANLKGGYDDLSNNILQLTGDVLDLESRFVLSTRGMALVFGAFAAFTGLAIASILASTPALIADFQQIKLDVILASRAIGEEFGPAMDVAVEASDRFKDSIVNASDETQIFIGVFVGAIALFSSIGLALTGIAIGASALGVSVGVAVATFGTFIAIILLAAAGIALVVIAIRSAIISFREGDAVGGMLKFVLLGLALAIAAVGIAAALGATGVFAFLAPLIFALAVVAALLGLIKLLIDHFKKVKDAAPATQMNAPSTMASGTVSGTVDNILATQADEFHSGGIFAGNRPGLAMLKPGERVLTQTEQRALGLLGGGNTSTSMGGTVNINVTINGGNYTSASQRRLEAEKFARELEKQNNTRGFI
jgi:hypothetical protein|tara:strand:+ start:457 stop:1659 length:1203 start_codon:yes stop_codon:yes gene_type:complete